MDAAGAALEVRDAAALGAAVESLLADPARRSRMVEAAARIAAAKARVLDETMAAIAPLLNARA